MSTRYLIVEPEWFFNDEFWSPFADDWGSARQQFHSEEAAQEEARLLNREALRSGRTPLPSWGQSGDDSARARLRTLLGLAGDEMPSWNNRDLQLFEKLSDAELDEIIELFGHNYFQVRALQKPESESDSSWHLVVECYPAFDRGGTILPEPSKDHEAFEKVLSIQPSKAAAEKIAMAFNTKVLGDNGQTVLQALGHDSFDEHTEAVLEILSLPAHSYPEAACFPTDGTLAMVRQLAKLLTFQYHDIRECPGMEILKD